MERNIAKIQIVTLAELKANLRIDAAVTNFDTDLQGKLDAAIAVAGHHISRDLTHIEAYSFRYAQETPINIDPACEVASVKINGTTSDAWDYYKGSLHISGEHSEDDIIDVSLRYKADIKAAIMLHASSIWQNPIDSVEQLPKASHNLLRPYRQYGV